jgi:murein DD-endopeptidase MepM/ murein hydrolase activator NlpD
MARKSGSMPRLSKKSKVVRRAGPWQGTLRMVLIFAALIMVNVYFFFLRGGTSLTSLLKASEQAKQTGQPAVMVPKPASPLPAAPGAPARPKEDDEDARVLEGVMQESDTVERVWRRDGLSAKDVNELSAALGRVFDLKTVRAGHSYTLRFDAEDHLRALDYRMTPALAFRVERTAKGWNAIRDEKPIETRVHEIGGTVGSSLYDAVRRSGESTSLVSWFVDMFAWDMNFYIDCHAGDTYRIIVEKRYLGGKFYKYGRVLAAEYHGRVGTFRSFWFQPKDGTAGNYYTEHGESVEKSLLKTPLKFVRVSSGFDRHRFHPVLHTERAHLGVDYAAPTGTPVWASASGRVSFVGPRGGAGNAVILAHGNGLESTYMHLSRFAKGLAAGQTVRQKQVIGYVGATGLATGPHLHFSLRKNGGFIDPLKFKPERSVPLPAAYRLEFADAIAPRLSTLAAIETRPPDRLMRSGPAPMP